MENPQGYAPGISASDAAFADRPLSRADDLFQSVKSLQDKIESKRVRIRDITHNGQPEVYARLRSKWVHEMQVLALKIEGLDKDYNEGPARVERIEKEIAALESKIATTENRKQVEKFMELRNMLTSAGINV